MQYLIMCRSLTWAQRSAALLERGGITASVVKAPQGLSTSGCGYAISIYRRFEEARNLLAKNNMINGKIFKRTETGEYQIMAGISSEQIMLTESVTWDKYPRG